MYKRINELIQQAAAAQAEGRAAIDHTAQLLDKQAQLIDELFQIMERMN